MALWCFYTLTIDMVFYGIGMRLFHTYADVSKILEFKDLVRTAFATLTGNRDVYGFKMEH